MFFNSLTLLTRKECVALLYMYRHHRDLVTSKNVFNNDSMNNTVL